MQISDMHLKCGCFKFSVLRREQFSLAVIVSTNSPKISDITKRDTFQFSFSQSDEKI